MGGFRISLTYDAPTATGKTSARTDTYHGHFVNWCRMSGVVETMAFESEDPTMQGEMTVTFTLTDADGGTDLLAVHDHVPPGIAPAANELGWQIALDKLKALVEESNAHDK
ncbi:MAG: SRPBCC domain-containing protein [Caldilineaceae bacterium]